MTYSLWMIHRQRDPAQRLHVCRDRSNAAGDFVQPLCPRRLGGSYRQPRQSLLRGPRQPHHHLAEAEPQQQVQPRHPPLRIHPADGAAQQEVRPEMFGLRQLLPGSHTLTQHLLEVSTENSHNRNIYILF